MEISTLPTSRERAEALLAAQREAELAMLQSQIEAHDRARQELERAQRELAAADDALAAATSERIKYERENVAPAWRAYEETLAHLSRLVAKERDEAAKRDALRRRATELEDELRVPRFERRPGARGLLTDRGVGDALACLRRDDAAPERWHGVGVSGDAEALAALTTHESVLPAAELPAFLARVRAHLGALRY